MYILKGLLFLSLPCKAFNQNAKTLIFFKFQLIFSGEYTVAMNKCWHLGHFRCKECNISITGKQFVAKQGKPVCQECYGAKHTNECAACKMTIGPQSKDVSTNDNRHWHDTCFLCDICRKVIVILMTRSLVNSFVTVLI